MPSFKDPTKRLSRLTFKLIANDLRRIAEHQKDPKKRLIPGYYAVILSRYFTVLMNHKRTTEKLEDEQRRALKKLSMKELKRLAGVPEASADAKPKPIQDKRVPKAS